MANIEIKNYDVNYVAGGSNAGGYPYRALIGLRAEDLTVIAVAYFHRSSETMPPADNQNASGYIACHYLAEDFPRILDLLRNEKPVYVSFVTSPWNHGIIGTGMEPIGEGELAS